MKLAHILNVVRSTQDFVSVVPNYAETCRFTNAIYTTTGSKNENMRQAKSQVLIAMLCQNYRTGGKITNYVHIYLYHVHASACTSQNEL